MLFLRRDLPAGVSCVSADKIFLSIAASNYRKVSLKAGTVPFLIRIQYRGYPAVKRNCPEQECRPRNHRTVERCRDRIHFLQVPTQRLYPAIIDDHRAECSDAPTIRTLSTFPICGGIRPDRN